LPQRVGERLGLGLAGELDRLDHRVDGVPAAETLGEAADVVLWRLPFGDELLPEVRVLPRIREPGREEAEMVGAIRGFTGLGNQLIRRNRTARCKDARLNPLAPR